MYIYKFSVDHYYGTPKPLADGGAPLLNGESLLPGLVPIPAVKRRRNKSVSDMEKAAIDPPEDMEEEERPLVNGNGVNAGEHLQIQHASSNTLATTSKRRNCNPNKN